MFSVCCAAACAWALFTAAGGAAAAGEYFHWNVEEGKLEDPANYLTGDFSGPTGPAPAIAPGDTDYGGPNGDMIYINNGGTLVIDADTHAELAGVYSPYNIHLISLGSIIRGAGGTLHVSGGRTLNLTGTLQIGGADQTTGHAVVSGANTVVSASAGMYVGNNGSGTLEILDGALVRGNNVYVAATKPGTTGSILVGAGSTLEADHLFLAGELHGQAGTATLSGTGTVKLTDTTRVFNLFPDATISPGDADGQTGTLTIDGSLLFKSGSTIKIDIAAEDDYDKIVCSGTVTYDGKSVIHLDSYTPGVYKIIETTGVMYAINDYTVELEGTTIDPTLRVQAIIEDGNALVLTLGSYDLIWRGRESNDWNITDNDWHNEIAPARNIAFLSSDYVIFDDTAEHDGNITIVGGGVTVSGMEVNGGEYSFFGGGITGTTTYGEHSVTGAYKQTGGAATFNVATSFSKGYEITGGTTVFAASVVGLVDIGGTAAVTFSAIGDRKNAFDIVQNSSGALTFDVTNAYATFTQSGAISGGGMTQKTGAGRLVLTGDNSKETGVFCHLGGKVDLLTSWGGAYEQDDQAGTFTSADGASIGGYALFTGDVDPAGALSIGGKATFTGTTIHYDLDAGDIINVGGKANLTGTTLDLDSFTKGSYTVLTSTGLTYDAFTITLNSGDIDERHHIVYRNENENLILYLDMDNLGLIWKGEDGNGGDGCWWDTNWDGSANNKFIDGDSVHFEHGGRGTVGLGNNTARPGDMTVEGNYTFVNGGLAGYDDTSTLTISGDCTRVTFANNGGLDFAAGMTVADGATAVFGDGFASTLNTSLNGGGMMEKSGSGTLYLDKPNTHSGGTFVTGGTLVTRNTGALGKGDVTVRNNSNLFLKEHGDYTPIGDLNVDGGANLNFCVDLDATDTSAPTLSTAHLTAKSVTIADDATIGMVECSVWTAYEGAPASTSVITADDFTIGANVNMSEHRAWYDYDFALNDAGTDLILTVRPTGATHGDFTNGHNSGSLGDMLDNAKDKGVHWTGELGDALEDVFNSTTDDEAAARLNELSPAVLAGGAQLPVLVATQFRHGLERLWRAKRIEDESMAGDLSSLDGYARLTSDVNERGWRFWAEGTGAWSQYDSPDDDPGYSATEWAATVAGYKSFGSCRQFTVGAAMNANYTRMDWDGSDSRTKGDSYAGALVAMFDTGSWFIAVDAMWGISDIDSDRDLPLANLGADADYLAHWFGGDLTLGYRWINGCWTVTPTAGARMYRFNTPLVTEKYAGTAGYVMEKDHRTGFELFARIDVSRTWELANGMALKPYGSLGVSMETEDRWATPTVHFVGAPASITSFRGFSPKGGRVAGEITAGLEARITARWSAYGEYAGEFRDNMQRHAGNLGVGFAF